VAAALPEIETRLAQVAHWWQQHQAGVSPPQAPDAVLLARTYIGALDIATDADYATKNWPAALPRLETILQVQQALQLSAQDIANTRMNRANVLKHLQRYDEAKAELEACLGVFQADPARSARVLSSLADLFATQNDLPQAIAQERHALALRTTLPNPQERAISHYNLALYLQTTRAANAQAESRYHQLADLIYCLCAGLQQDLQTSLHNYANTYRQAHSHATEQAPHIPRIAELLAEPGFYSLHTWLQSWFAQEQTNLAQLQATVDEVLGQIEEQVKQAIKAASATANDSDTAT
jgi:tetratricopeptide (TPR) repeat protein